MFTAVASVTAQVFFSFFKLITSHTDVLPPTGSVCMQVTDCTGRKETSSPFFPLDPSLAATVVALLLQGLGISITTITCLNLMTVRTKANSESAEGIVTSLWVTCELLGNYLWSTFGGMADETWGFRGGTICMFAIESAIMAILIIAIVVEHIRRKMSSNVTVWELCIF